jgi:drug/metabolite transporter (DMT)-like permease
MTPRVSRGAIAIAVTTAVLFALALAAGILVVVNKPGAIGGHDQSSAWTTISFLIPLGAFAFVGNLISLRQPGNRIGPLMALIGLFWTILLASLAISGWGLTSHSLPQGVAEWIYVGSAAWVPALGLTGTQLLPRLPDGELPSPRWRWYSRISIVLIAIACLGMTSQEEHVLDIKRSHNPLDLAVLKPLASVILLVIAAFVAGIVALVRRYRQSEGRERAQLRWVAFAGLLFVGIYLVTLPAAGNSDVATFISQAAFAALPIGIGYAILRHNLYDIDVVIRRTVVYAGLTATLAGIYVGTVLLLQLALGGVTQDSGLAVAGSTLAVAALFQPVRTRIQETVDRRFFRSRYDARRTLEDFSSRLRDQVDLAALDAELRGVITETMQPAHVSVWLRGTGAE